MRRLLAIIFALVIVCGIAYIFFIQSKSTVQQNLLGENPTLHLFTIHGTSTGLLNITIPFVQASKETYVIDIALDLNRDGQITDDEWSIKDASAHLVQNLKNNFLFTDETRTLALNDDITIKIKFRKANSSTAPVTLEKKVKLEAFEIGESFGFSVPGGNEDLKRGIGLPQTLVSVASAEGEEVFRAGMTPDLAQDRMECAAVAAANNLMSLAGEHDKLGDLPEFTGDLIEELKTDMKFNNGISLANMVAGKNAFTERHHLPISTELKFAPTKDDILKALNSGAAVELSFAFVLSKSGRDNTGHVVTLVGGSPNQLFVHDSGTPEGMDTLRMYGTVQTPKHTFINVPYPLWDGVAYIDGIVIQNWTEPSRAEESYTDTGEQASEVEMLVLDGHYFPKSFFRIAHPDSCNASHYHAVNPNDTVYGLKSVTSRDVVPFKDPNRDACGFGKVSEVPIEKITITFEQSQKLIESMPEGENNKSTEGGGHTPNAPSSGKVCGLPGGPMCPPR